MDFIRADKKDPKSTFQGGWKTLDGVSRLGVLPGANNKGECILAGKNILTAVKSKKVCVPYVGCKTFGPGKNGPNAGDDTFNHRKYIFVVVW